MKTSTLLLLILLGFGNPGFSNPFVKIPANVQAALVSNFSHVENVKWFKIQDAYGAKFQIDNKLMYAFFNESGVMYMINAQMSYSELNPNIKEKLDADYAHCFVKAAFRLVERSGYESYMIVLENMQTGEEFEVPFK